MSTILAGSEVARPSRRRLNGRRVRNRVLLYAALVFYLIAACFPVYYMLMSTLKADYDLIDPSVNPFWFKRPLGLEHFQYLFTRTNFSVWGINTVVVAACVLGITLAICIPGGYALARLRVPGGQHLAVGVFLTYLIPPILLFIPLNQLVANLFNLENSRWALVLVYPTFTIPFCLWLMMGFFRRVPKEIEEAALVDGCNRWQAVRRVVLPVSVPGIITVGIFAFTLAMQDFIYALVMVSSSDQKVINVGVPTELIRGDVYFWGELLAAALLPGVIIAFIYNFFLDYFVQGITGGIGK
ncbi:MAG TPA: carbohydrate ABC transporter permease [Candidatus Dormibacteraeota bacterium]|jgi:multiple sugar transport system permease protein|nr:carbohydrate ABC transporter permease [Candidatus Dormibacteraeota bacterium]